MSQGSCHQSNELKEKKIFSWFLTGLKNEYIRLGKRHQLRQKQELLILNEFIFNDSEDHVTERLNHIAALNNTSRDVEDSLLVEYALSLLTPKQQKILVETIMNERTEKEIAQKLGVSQVAVHRMKERALKKVRKHFIKDKHTF